MEIRLAGKKDLEVVKRIWNYCFQDSEDYVAFYFKEIYLKRNQVLLAELNGRVIGTVHLNNKKLKVGNKTLEVPYVVGVAILPEARGKGIMKQLMKSAFTFLYENHQELVLLMPINRKLYEPYGFRFTMDLQKLRFSQEDMPRTPKISCVAEPFCTSSNQHREDISSIYSQYTDRNMVVSHRTLEDVSLLGKEIDVDGGFIYLIYSEDNHRPLAYLIYYIEKNHLEVREYAYVDKTGLLGLLQFLNQHQTQVKAFTIMAKNDDYLRLMMQNNASFNMEVKQFMMSRIINLQEFVTKYCLDRPMGCVTIEIIDHEIEENNGTYKLFGSEEELTFEKVLFASISKDIIISIGEFTQFLLGYLTVEDLEFFENITISEQGKQFMNRIRLKDFKHQGTNIKSMYFNEYI